MSIKGENSLLANFYWSTQVTSKEIVVRSEAVGY